MSVTISDEAASALAIRALLDCGGSPDMARSLAGATVAAERQGRAEMGFAHLVDYLASLRAGRIDGQAEPVITAPLPATLHCDARSGIAQLGFDLAFERLVAAASTLGIAIFTLANGYTAGELGHYVRRLAQRGLLALAASSSHAMLAPAPGAGAVYGTNPLAFAAPRAEPHPPLVIDQASSATAFVNLLRAAESGQAIPPGWAIDATGAPTLDPSEAVKGALLPFGGAKGANVALLVEVLAAGLSGGAWSSDAGHFMLGASSPGTGLTVIAIAATAVGPNFAARLDTRLDQLAMLGVHIPGAEARTGDGSITLAASLIARIEGFIGKASDKVSVSD